MPGACTRATLKRVVKQPDGVYLVRRDDVVRKLIVGTRRGRSLVSGTRIIDSGLSSIRVSGIRQVRQALGEVTSAFRLCGNDALQVDRILLANFLQIHKEKGLVFLQRTAQREPILIPHMVGFFAGVEEVSGIKRRS